MAHPTRLALACLCATLGTVLSPACRDLPPAEPRGSFTFAVFGDGPYRAWEMGRFRRLLRDVNASDVALLIHVGDILWYPCSDRAFRERRAALATLTAPVVYTPGDNEWTDCHERIAGAYDPLDRLRALREIFFADASWSGVQALHPVSQASEAEWPAYVENVRWEYGGIVFATIHVVGSDNGLEPFPTRTAASDAEAAERTEAVVAWIGEAFAVATQRDARAVVLAMHADPYFDSPGGRRDGPFAPLYAALDRALATWSRPVLLIHGDNHELHVDHPLRNAAGDTVRRFVRLETYGSPDIGWVRVVVDTTDPDLFAFEPRRMPKRFLLW